MAVTWKKLMYESDFLDHSARHEDGGADEISVAGLSGDLADLQDPKDHTHQSAGSGVGGKIDHGLALDGLADDDHTQYALLAGRSGGQTLIGGTDPGEDLRLKATSDVSQGDIFFATGNTRYNDSLSSFLIQGPYPGFWLDETDAKGVYFVLDAGIFQIQRRAASFGAYEASPFYFDITSPSFTLAADASGNVGIGTYLPGISDGIGLHIEGKILRIKTSKTPANSGATGNPGEICWDATYIYICTATNTWKRITLETF